MRTCLRCNTPIPDSVDNARFCVGCGWPVSQPCPYGCVQILSMRDGSNMPPATCGRCGGFLTYCTSCGRLHRIDEELCSTPDCNTRLKETTEAFASPAGPLDGTHCVTWPSRLSGRTYEVSASRVDELKFIAYRHGVLVGLSDRSLAIYCWDENGQEWNRKRMVAFSGAGLTLARSLLIEDGRAFILSDDVARVVDLAAGIVVYEHPGSFLRQTKIGHWWAMLSKVQARLHLSIVDCDYLGGDVRLIELPEGISDVAELIAGDREIVLGARTGELIRIDPKTGDFHRWEVPKHRWARIAVSRGRVIAAGFVSDGKLALFGLSNDGSVESHGIITGEVVDFAYAGEQVYLMGKHRLAIFCEQLLSETQPEIRLSGGQSTRPGAFALHDRSGKWWLLLRRSDSSNHELHLIDAASGAVTTIGERLSEEPLVCTADSRIVVGSRESDGMTLRTYAIREGT